MSTDLDQLLDGASGDPATPIDADALWASGRRRRWLRRAGATGGTAALVLVVALAGVNLAGSSSSPDVAPLAPSAPTEPTETTAPVEDTTVDEATARAEARAEARARHLEMRERLEQEQLEREELERQAAAEEAAAREAEAEEAAATLSDPCAPHAGRDMDVFIDVVGPTSGSAVGSSFELVGCSNVYEATVSYRLLEAGTVLVEHFTTADCGSGCVGEFRETVTVPAGDGSLTLEVFWASPADGEGERDKVTIHLERA